MNLFPHQIDAVQRMVVTDSFLLADEPGLGKTPVLCTVAYRVWRGEQILIVCPRNVIAHWRACLEKWAPQIASKKISRIVNYEMLKNLSVADVEQVGILIIDEGHKLKNEESQRFQKMYELWRQMNWANASRGSTLRVYMATGTPVYSYPIDLLTILILLRKMEIRDVSTFKFRYCAPSRRSLPGRGRVLDVRGASNLRELSDSCASFVLRRSWADVGIRMPSLTLTEIAVNEKVTDPEYSKASAAWAAYYTSKGGRPEAAGLARFTSLRKMLAIAKIPAVLEQALDDLRAGLHTTCFTEFRDSAQAIYDKLLAEGKKAVLIMGGQSLRVRQELLDNFIKSKEPMVLVATTDSIGEGTDGLQNVCRLVNVLDIDFEASVMFVQVFKRVFRLGQAHPVNVRLFFLENDALENFISENVSKKEGHARALGFEDSTSFARLRG